MNLILLCGRLTKDPEVRYGANNTAIARFSIAVDRRFKRDGQPTADFFNCTAFGKTGEFIEKYFRKGSKILLNGEMQNDNYKNKDGQMVYGFQVLVNNVEFAESKAESQQNGYAPQAAPAQQADTDFMQIPDGIEESLPFN
jgi:single-strand DNA-binding protein